MNQSLIIGIIVGAVVGSAITATGFYIVKPPAASIATLDIPTAEEANTAFQQVKNNKWTLNIGTCEKNPIGPGVACSVEYTDGNYNITRQGTVGFSRSPNGWLAVHYN